MEEFASPKRGCIREFEFECSVKIWILEWYIDKQNDVPGIHVYDLQCVAVIAAPLDVRHTVARSNDLAAAVVDYTSLPCCGCVLPADVAAVES